jgi:hypothetical protein
MKFKPEDKETLRREQAAYNESRRNRNEIQELRSQLSEQQGLQPASSTAPPVDAISVSQRSQVSQVTTGQHSIMGGRNEQAQIRQNRRAAAVVTMQHVRSTTPVTRLYSDPPENTAASNECDTNADTCCLGTNFVVLQQTFRTADVFAYDSSMAPIENIPIVSAATAYDDSVSGDTFILVFHEALYYGSRLDHSLINPNQVRSCGIPFWDNPYDPAHGLSIDVDDSLSIPLHPVGTKLQFRTRVPTKDELARCEHIDMTSATPWNPSEVVMLQETDQGGSVGPWKRYLSSTLTRKYEYVDASSDDALLDSVDPSLVHLGRQLCTHHSVAQVDTVYEQRDIPSRRTFVSTERHEKVSAELLADRFGIGTKRAQRTLRVTTQRGVRSAILPISRRYRADWHVRDRRKPDRRT